KGLPVSLDKALDALEADHEYLTKGGVFPEDLIVNYIRTKRSECADLAKIPTVPEFDRYFNC
ncbi:MAG: glutamine synthetase, partial [Lachnospiraceae bacterium]|nr:glutamine synthetase [Lachnospiraceae bacterium]